jgi:glycosyltransferase involved in cell wall biosynthesis
MAHADLLVSTSAFEGSPGVLIEALAAGLPVVATDCPGGSVELLEDGEGGMLVPMDDAAATAEAIVAMLDRPRDRQRLQRIAEPYTVEASAAAYLEALDTAVAQRG